MVGVLADVLRLHAQILERLGLGVNDLVVHFTVQLLRRHRLPVEELVEDLVDRLQDMRRDVDVSALLEDFAINKSGNFSRRVVLGAIKLIRLASRGIIEANDFKSATDVNHMDRPETLLHVVDREQVGEGSKLKKQVIFKAKRRRRTHNGRLGEDLANDSFTAALGLKELTLRLGIGIVRRDVHKPVNIVLGDSIRDALSALDMNVFEGKVPVDALC